MKDSNDRMIKRNPDKCISLTKNQFSWKHFIQYEILVTVILVIGYGHIHFQDLKYMYLDIGADTFSSYWPLYLLYQDVIQGFEGFWSFRNGLGGNIIVPMMFFDPFVGVLCLFPEEETAEALLLITVIKMYTISALAYFYFKKIGFSEKSVCFGALCYTFSGFVVSWGQHYAFATAFVYLTLCLYAFEYWVHEKKWYLLTLSVAALVLFSSYFAYVILLFLAIYVIFRYFALYQFQVKSFLKYGFSLLAYVLLGIGLGAVIFLPSIYVLTHSARVNGAQGMTLQLGTPLYYLSVFLRYFSDTILGVYEYYGSPGYFTGQVNLNFYEMPFFYVGVLFIALLPLLFRRGSCGITAKVAMGLVVTAILFVGISGSLFNGFSMITTRWTMVLVPIQCLGICKGIEILLEDPLKNSKYCFLSVFVSGVILLCVYAGRTMLFGSQVGDMQTVKLYLLVPVVVILLYGLLFFACSFRKVSSSRLTALLLLLLVADLGRNTYMSAAWNRALPSDPEYVYFDGTQYAVEWIAQQDDDFYRIEKSYRQVDLTDSFVQEYAGEKQYSSTFSADYDKFREIFNLRLPNSNYLWGFDDKQALRNLAAGKYYLTKTPIQRYGYTLLEQVAGIFIYENKNALPIAYMQDQVFAVSDLSGYSMQEKQNILYKGFLSEDEEILAKYPKISAPDNMVNDTEVQYSEVRDDDGNCIGITLNEPSTGTLILHFTFEKGSLANGAWFNESIVLSGSDLETYNQSTFFVNHADANLNPELEVEISALGVETIDWSAYASNLPISFEISEKKDTVVDTYCKELRQRGMKIQKFTDSNIIGQIDIEEPGMLVSSIPYDEGWSVFVDGEQRDVHKVNMIYLGVELSEGNHIIEFRYIPKGLVMGSVISSISVLMVLALLLWERKKNGRSKR